MDKALIDATDKFAKAGYPKDAEVLESQLTNLIVAKVYMNKWMNTNSIGVE